MLAALPPAQVRALFPSRAAFVQRHGVGPGSLPALRQELTRRTTRRLRARGRLGDTRVRVGGAAVLDHSGHPVAGVAVTYPVHEVAEADRGPLATRVERRGRTSCPAGSAAATRERRADGARRPLERARRPAPRVGAMKAITIPVPGDADALVLADVPAPEPGPTDVLVTVAAAGVNRADLMQRQGFYDPPPGASPYPGPGGQRHGRRRRRRRSRAGRSATRCARCCPVAATPSRWPSRPGSCCRCRRACRCGTPPRCPRWSARSGPTSS